LPPTDALVVTETGWTIAWSYNILMLKDPMLENPDDVTPTVAVLP
jgi:hypothetical protein